MLVANRDTEHRGQWEATVGGAPLLPGGDSGERKKRMGIWEGNPSVVRVYTPFSPMAFSPFVRSSCSFLLLGTYPFSAACSKRVVTCCEENFR